MIQRPRGLFISFEGTEGSGKSTLVKTLSQQLKELGFSVICTREPGGSPSAEKIRSFLLQQTMEPWTELFLIQAARAEHMAKTILPALRQGQIVLCDRFTDSTLAYQAQARGLPWKQVQWVNRIASQGVQPHLVVFLDIDPKIGLLRAKDRNRFEAEGVEFQKQVRTGFLKARRERPKNWLTLKVEKSSPQQLAQCILKVLDLKALERKLKIKTAHTLALNKSGDKSGRSNHD
jgi:dTMP kinase